MSFVNSEYSVKSRTSAYQTDGKPLSKEALYRAKLKYGIYDSPSATTLGVSSSTAASDTAALLANSTDLSIEPYKRSVAADAQTAALLARKDSAPQKWIRHSIDTDAASAALSAKTVKQAVVARDDRDSSSAASAVLGSNKSGRSIGSLASANLASLYEFDAVRNGQKKSDLNIAKITKASQQRANTLMNSRMNPEWDASKSGLQTQSKLDNEALEAFAAVGALASQNYKAPVDKNLEAASIYRNSLVDPKVLAAASLNADHTLKGIDKYLSSKDLLRNADYNRMAMEIAQRHHQKRALVNEKVNLGGGLYMSQDELDAIAAKFVNPVLDQINKTAEAQRAKDAELAKQKEEARLAHEKYKAEQKAKKMEEQRLKAEAKAQRRKELEEQKKQEKEAKLALEKAKKEELAKHKSILTSKQKEEERKKKELLEKKEAETQRIAKEEAEAKAKREAELKAAEQERDEKLAPILASLKQEQDKLAVLDEEKKAVQDITDSQILNTENSQKLLEASKLELVNAEETLEQLKIDIENSTNESEKLAKEAELKNAEAEVALKKSQELEAEASLKQAEIDKEKAIVENERLKIELELENEKIAALEEEKKIAETLPPTVTKTETETGTAKAVEDTTAPEASSTPTDTAATTEEPTTKDATTTTVVTGTGPVETSVLESPVKKSNSVTSGSPTQTRYRSMVDDALDYDPRKAAPATTTTTTEGESKKDEIDGGELKQTFSGFSQGSNEHKHEETEDSTPQNEALLKEEETEDKHKSIFKEEF